jgi:SAM-dependent methyltransferase
MSRRRCEDGRIVSDARYDGFADWYDERFAPSAPIAGEVLEEFLGRGSGCCLDLCCGTGLHFDALLALGWRVTAVDVSDDQLRIARRRGRGRVDLVQADGAALPFRDAAFEAVVSLFSHTDVDDFGSVVDEGARVLRPGGLFVYVGLHPCFVGPHAQFAADQEVPTLHQGYGSPGRYTKAPGISPEGLWAKVSGNHMQLGQLMQAFLDAPLLLERFREHGDDDYPRTIALRARRKP